MDFAYNDRTKELVGRVQDFMDRYVYPNEEVYYEQLDEGDNRWKVIPVLEELKEKAREEGLWNLFLPESELGGGLTNLEYAPVCEVMGRINWEAGQTLQEA